MKVVIDTNVFISAIMRGGNPERILKAWERGRFNLFVSQEILKEVLETMSELGFPEEKVIAWKNLITKQAHKVVPSKRLKIITADPDDNIFLECALEVGANYIVSGDKHLLDLGEYEGIKILTPKGFLEGMEK